MNTFNLPLSCETLTWHARRMPDMCLPFIFIFIQERAHIESIWKRGANLLKGIRVFLYITSKQINQICYIATLIRHNHPVTKESKGKQCCPPQKAFSTVFMY